MARRSNQGRSLEQIAQEINRLHGEVQALDTKMEELQVQIDEADETRQEKAQKIGEKLIEAKFELPHGKFQKWVATNCPDIDERTARHYMAFARDDVDNLDSGGKRSPQGADAELPELTDRQKKAIEMVREGKSYRQIGEELDTDESNIRKDPIIRAVRQEHDPDAHSTTTRASVAACRTLSVDERVEDIERNVEYLFDMDMYKIGKAHRNRLRKVADKIKKELEVLDG